MAAIFIARMKTGHHAKTNKNKLSNKSMHIVRRILVHRSQQFGFHPPRIPSHGTRMVCIYTDMQPFAGNRGFTT